MRLRNILQLFIPLFVLVACCSCGVNPPEQAKTAGEASPAPTVSPDSKDSVESAVFKNSEDTVKKKRLENDFMRVYVKDNDDLLFLENLDGTDQKKIDIKNLCDPFWLTNDWLYYATIDWDADIEVFYRAPVDQDNGRGTVDISKKEELFRGEEIEYGEFMLTDSYILYLPYLDDDDHQGFSPFFRYDFATGKSTEIKGFNGIDQYILYEESSGLPILLGETFFVGDDMSGKTYRVSIDTLEKEVFFADGALGKDVPGYMTEYQGDIYSVLSGEKYELWKYDGDSGEHTCLLSGKKLDEIIGSMDLWQYESEPKTIQIRDLGIYQNRIYLHVHMESKELMENIDDVPKYEKEILLSAELSDISRWELEKKVTDYLQEKDGYISEISEGIIYIYLYWGKSPALYHISTGEIEELKDTDYRFWRD